MKKLIHSFVIIVCLLLVATSKLYANEPPSETVIKAWEQFADQFLADKNADKKVLDAETERILNNKRLSYEAKDSLVMIKESEFTKKWNAELLKRLKAKPEYEGALKITQKLMDHNTSYSNACDIWNKQVLAKDPDAYQNIIEGIQVDYPFKNEWEAKFIQLVNETPEMLDYPSSLIEDVCGIQVCNSADRKLKCYSWDYYNGGSAVCSCYFEQFLMSDGNVKVPVIMEENIPWGIEADPNDEDSPWDRTMPWEWQKNVEKIITIDTGIWTVYLLESTLHGGFSRTYNCIDAKVISGDKCLDFPIFSVDGEMLTGLETAAIAEFKYDKKTKTLTFDEYEEGDEYVENVGWFRLKGKARYVLEGSAFRKR